MPDAPLEDFLLGDYTVRVREGRLLGPRGEVRLEPRVMNVLVYLAGRAGEVVLRSELIDAVWPRRVGADESLTRCISNLRRALGDDRADPCYLETVPKRGYRLMAPVRALNAGSEPARETAPPTPRSIAVLPFSNLSDDSHNEYFGDGLAEEILTALTKIDGLRVAARMSSFAFKGRREDARRVGERLGVAAVLEGGVRRAGERVRVTVQLVDAADGYQLWSERYDRDLADIFAIQDDIAQSIVRALEVTLSPCEQRAVQFTGVHDVRAYEHYLRGRTYFHQFTVRDLGLASQSFERALAIEPEFARAWAGLADCDSFYCLYYAPSQARRERALDASRRAVQLAPESAEAHASRGLAHMVVDDHAEAEAAFRTAEALDPKLFEAWYFHGRACTHDGDLVRAAELFERAAAVRPEDYQALLFASSMYSGLNVQDKAAATARRGVEAADRHLALSPDDVRALYLGANGLLALGQREAAVARAERAQSVQPDDTIVLYNVACIYARVGKTDKALECLEHSEHAFNRAGGYSIEAAECFRHDPDLATLRGHPRFEALFKRAAKTGGAGGA